MIPDADPLLILSLVIVGGLIAGRLARRVGVAGVTGQILLGVGLGHSGLALFSAQDISSLAPVTDFALGLIAVTVGGHLNLRRMGGSRRRLGLILLAESTITPVLVYLACRALGADWRTSMLFAALAVSTAPATVVALIGETRSRGVFTKTLLGAVALNNIACILLFEVAHMATRVGLATEGGSHPGIDYVFEPLKELVLAAALGGAVGGALVMGTRHMFRSNQLSTASVVCVLLTAGLAGHFQVSSLLACLFLGVTLANLTPDKDEIVESAFVNVRAAIFAIFFTLAGMHLDLGTLAAGGVLVLVVFLARFAGKALAAHLALRVAGATDNLRRYLGMALVPQAGVAVGLVLLVSNDPVMESIASQVLAVTLAVVTANELIGPVLVKLALVRSGEAGMDRDRILEFLHEENIVVGLRAETKEEAIEQLVDVLIRTNHLDADRERLLQSVLDREAAMSTCFGEGLAVPHGIHESGQRIVGAMGISRRGLAFETPDDRPVHCMVVLATPGTERDRHLQVLAALAQAIGTDANRQHQLFTAASAAHAYEILHAKGAQEFNWYVEDTVEAAASG